MSFVTRDVAQEIVRRVGPLVARVEEYDENLAEETRRLAASMMMNIGAAGAYDGEERQERFRAASGKAAALAAALDIATIWSYINRPDETLALLDRLGGLLHGLIHGKGKAA